MVRRYRAVAGRGKAWARKHKVLVRAFRRVMVDQDTVADRAKIARWVERTVMDEVSALRVVAEPCWFPTCTRGSRHPGQHSGITVAGRKLVRIRDLTLEALDTPPDGPARYDA
ncbi:MAG: hypothetical protein ACREN5_06905, partial [Gemmatimonadales bacterium]